MAVDKIVGIIGWPVSHSLSPAMHNRAFLESGLSAWCYVPMPVCHYPHSRVKEAIFGLRALGFQGANVTVPYKEAVLPYLDEISQSAAAIGAVNTIVVDAQQRLIGHNTDSVGFIRDLADHQIRPKDVNVLILGAGGSARAITYGLLSHHCQEITILNRTKSKADQLASTFRESFKSASINTGQLTKESLIKNARKNLIINTTSLGLNETKHEMPWHEDIHFSSEQIVYDLIYHPKMTTLLKHANGCGARVINGLGMLIYQGAAAFEIWTGHTAPVQAMKDAVLNVSARMSEI